MMRGSAMQAGWPFLCAALGLMGCAPSNVQGDDIVGDEQVQADLGPDLSSDAPVDVWEGADDAASADEAGKEDSDQPADANDASEEGAPTEWSLLFQCVGIGGGICRMKADGGDRQELLSTGHDPVPEPSGGILFHTDGYHVNRLKLEGGTDDLGEGAFPELAGSGGILFQCTGLGGGICRMNSDGSGREQLHASGRAPVPGPDGSVLFHSDGYHVMRRHSGGDVDDLGEGAFPRPAADGSIIFQCRGLAGGLCRMAMDGTGRTEIRASGREPDENSDGWIAFHSDGYSIWIRQPDGTEQELGPGRSAVWEQ